MIRGLWTSASGMFSPLETFFWTTGGTDDYVFP